MRRLVYLPSLETNSKLAPENWWQREMTYFPFGKAMFFRCETLVSGRVPTFLVDSLW